MTTTFTLGTSTILGEFIIPRIIPEVMEQLPEVRLKLDISNSLKTFEMVQKGEIEIGVIGTRYESDRVQYMSVSRDDKLVIIAPSDHPLVGAKDISLADLKGQNFINRELGSGTRMAYEQTFRQAGLALDDLRIVAEIGNTEGIIQAVEAGAGLSVISELAVQDALRAGRVAVLDLPLAMNTNFYIITNQTKPLSPTAQQILGILKEVVFKLE